MDFPKEDRLNVWFSVTYVDNIGRTNLEGKVEKNTHGKLEWMLNFVFIYIT